MTTFGGSPLVDRLATLAPEPMRADWLDVRRRVRDRRRRTLGLTALAAAVAVLLVGCTAVFGPRLIDFSGSRPSSPRTIAWVELVSTQGIHGGPPIDASATRTLLRRQLGGAVASLDLTPADGSFCLTATARRPGFRRRALTSCPWGRTGPEALAFADPLDASRAEGAAPGHVGGYGAVAGWTTMAGADHLELVFEDGARLDAPLVGWVGEPIDAAFFLVPIAQKRRAYPHRLARVIVVDGDGKALVGRPVPVGDAHPWAFPRGLGWPRESLVVGGWDAEHHGFPPTADESRARKLRFPGSRVQVWAAPARGGVTCYIVHDKILNAGGADFCPNDPLTRAAFALDADSIVLPFGSLAYWGLVPHRVAVVELRFEDGSVTRTRPQAGLVVSPIPWKHHAPGTRLNAAVLRDAAGNVVRRIRIETDLDAYR